MSQAVAWNDRTDYLDEKGFGLVSVTADDVQTVKRFAARRNIGYPLLADSGKQVISAFGLFNDGPPSSSRYYGTAIPTVVVVDSDGVVTHVIDGHGFTSDSEIEGIVERALEKPAS